MWVMSSVSREGTLLSSWQKTAGAEARVPDTDDPVREEKACPMRLSW